MFIVRNSNGTNIKCFTSYMEALKYFAVNGIRGSIVKYEQNGSITTIANDKIVDNYTRDMIVKLVEDLLNLHKQIIDHCNTYNDYLFQKMFRLGHRMSFYAPFDFEIGRCIGYLSEVKDIVEVCINSDAVEYKKEMNKIKDRTESIITAIILSYGGLEKAL